MVRLRLARLLVLVCVIAAGAGAADADELAALRERAAANERGLTLLKARYHVRFERPKVPKPAGDGFRLPGRPPVSQEGVWAQDGQLLYSDVRHSDESDDRPGRRSVHTFDGKVVRQLFEPSLQGAVFER